MPPETVAWGAAQRREREKDRMSGLIDVALGQKWSVYKQFHVRRNDQVVRLAAGSVLVVKTVPKGCDAFWVTCDGQRFRVSQEDMKDHARVLR